MSSEISRAGAPSIIVGSADVTMMTLAELNRLDEASEREAMRDEREAMEDAGERRLVEMSAAADLRLATGIVKAGASAAKAVAGGLTAGSEANSMERDAAGIATNGADAASGALGAMFEHYASTDDREAAAFENASDRARARMDERRADATEASGSADKSMETLSTIASENARSAEAASRA